MTPAPLIRPGLVSITFRSLAPAEIVRLAASAGLTAIEWGGDVHCPPGDEERAASVRAITLAAGLDVYAYGSYYRAGGAADTAAVIRTAVVLGAPAVRVWAGTVGSADATAGDRARVREDLRILCDAAERRGVTVALEYHNNTLTDTSESAAELLRAVGRPNLRIYWQPRHGLTVDGHLADIAALRPWLRDVHVFHWWPTPATRHALAEGADRWRAYLAELMSDGVPRVAALEFVRDDRPEQLMEDAATLRRLLAECG